MKLSKRIIGIFLAAVIAVTYIPAIAFASDDFTGASGTWHNNITWELSADGVLTFSGEGEMYSDSWQGTYSNSVYPWRKNYHDKIRKVVIKEGITSIGTCAFGECPIDSIEIAGSVKKLGNAVFKDCTNLTSVTIPANWATVGVATFKGCTSLNTVIIKNGFKETSYEMFRDCTSLQSVSLPDSLITIGQNSFYGCTSLESIDIPVSVTTIKKQAFGNCTSLESLFLPLDVLYIKDPIATMHSGKGSLKRIDVDENNQYFCEYDGVLYDKEAKELIECPANIQKTSITVPSWVKVIKESAFYNSNVQEVEFTDDSSLNAIEDYAFYNSNLTSFTFPDDVVSIGKSAFEHCDGLHTIVIPDKVLTIKSSTFGNCENLESIDFGKSVQKIENYACHYCALKSITLPRTITSLGSGVFAFNTPDNTVINIAALTAPSMASSMIGTDRNPKIHVPKEAEENCSYEQGAWAIYKDYIFYDLEDDPGSGDEPEPILKKITLNDLWSFCNPVERIYLDKIIDVFGVFFGVTERDCDDGLNGLCNGMCTCALAITHKDSPSLETLGISSLRELSETQVYNTVIPNMNMTLMDYIVYGQIYQYSNAWQVFLKNNLGNYDLLYQAIDDYFTNDGEPPIITIVLKANHKKAHALLPISMQKSGNDLIVGIYDCNDPDSVYYITLKGNGDHITGFEGYIKGAAVSDSVYTMGYTCITNGFIRDLQARKYEAPGVFQVRLSPGIDLVHASFHEVTGALHYLIRSYGDLDNEQNEYTLLWSEAFDQPITLENVPKDESVLLISDNKSIEVIPGVDASVVLTPKSVEKAVIQIDGNSSAVNTIKTCSGSDIESVTMTTASIHGQSVSAVVQGSDIEITGAEQIEMTQVEGELIDSSNVDGDTINAVSKTDLDPTHSYQLDTQTGSITDKDDETGTDPEPAPKPKPEPVHQHTYGGWSTTIPATEIAAGTQIRKCAECGNIETREVAQLAPTLKAVKISKPKATKKTATIKWKKISKKDLKKIRKIEIQYSTNSAFLNDVKTKYSGAKKKSCKIKGLKKGKKYYVRIRAYTRAGGQVHVSKWSENKSFKVK